MDLRDFTDPIFIAKVIDFALLIVAIVVLYERVLKGALIAQQDAQNKAVADALAQREENEHAVEAARRAIEQAKADAARMIEIGKAQAQRLVVDEVAEARERAARILAHAGGELERERYRVRRELLEETVERATADARQIVQRDLTPEAQRRLVERAIESLESARA